MKNKVLWEMQAVDHHKKRRQPNPWKGQLNPLSCYLLALPCALRLDENRDTKGKVEASFEKVMDGGADTFADTPAGKVDDMRIPLSRNVREPSKKV